MLFQKLYIHVLPGDPKRDRKNSLAFVINLCSIPIFFTPLRITGNGFQTRMHSSRMRTARMLPVSPSMHCSRGGAPGLGGCTWSRGVYLVPGGGYLVPGDVPAQVFPPPPMDRITDACGNITLPQHRCGR